MWADIHGKKKGMITSETQINSDLNAYHNGDTIQLAYRSAGLKGAVKKTWQKIFVISFKMSELK